MQNTDEKTEDRRRGKQIVWEKYFYGLIAHCPSCGKDLGYDYQAMPHFCPNCGQRLRGGRMQR